MRLFTFAVTSLSLLSTALGTPTDACCCCDVNEGVISCNADVSAALCLCAAVDCPDNAPTVWVTPEPEPTPPPPSPEDTCCCCDPDEQVIICNEGVSAALCDCIAAECPADASTVWVTPVPLPEPTPLPQDDCCCCDPQIPAISCTPRSAFEPCACPAVACPSGVPTIYPEVTPTPTPEPTPEPEPETEECCCCDVGASAISCKRQETSEGCVCPMVMCPPGSPTIWPEGGEPRPTDPASYDGRV